MPGDVTGFDARVRASRLDQMAVPTAAVSMNGQQITNLTDNFSRGFGSSDPVWSADGTKSLFVSHESGFGLATMNPDGTDRHFISSNPEDEHQPDWETAP